MLDLNEPKICKCGCGREIIIKPWYKYKGIPDYINGHNHPWPKGKKRSKENIEKLTATRKAQGSPWNKGRHHTEKAKKNMSEGKKGKLTGENSPNYGKHLSNETKLKISKANIGKRRSEEVKRKIGLSNRGVCAGSKHYKWNGLTPITKQIRDCFEYRQWRSDIFTRDDFTCHFCGIRGGYIEVDHYPKTFTEIFNENKIKSFEQGIACEEFWNINNGRTLCRNCHNATKNGSPRR